MRQEVESVPLSGPYLGEREEELVLEVLRSGRLSLGPTVDRFEEGLVGQFVDLEHMPKQRSCSR